MKIRVHVFIAGRVQGVFFRAFIYQEASRRNVNGWARNLPDGRVEAVFEGEGQEVNEIVKICRKGPSSARVDTLTIKREDYTGKFKDFKIQY